MTNLCVRPKRVSFWNDFDSLFTDLIPANFDSGRSVGFTPRVDVRDTEDKIFLTFELPGQKNDDISVVVEDNVLTVSGSSKKETEEKNDAYVRREIRSGSFSRSFTLPETVNSEKVTADYSSGLLKVSLEKIEKVKPKQIDVKVS